MNYPFWDVPHIGSGWVIGIVAIFHMMIALFAVGGGSYLVLAERKALRENRRDWLEALAATRSSFSSSPASSELSLASASGSPSDWPTPRPPAR